MYDANVVSKEDNVKAVVTKIELGEGDAGIVYVTDAAASDKVTTVTVPDEANVPATYAGVVVKASPNQGAATAFLDWLAGPAGQAILAEFGFLPPAVMTDPARCTSRSSRPRGRGRGSDGGRLAGRDRRAGRLFLGAARRDPHRPLDRRRLARRGRRHARPSSPRSH